VCIAVAVTFNGVRHGGVGFAISCAEGRTSAVLTGRHRNSIAGINHVAKLYQYPYCTLHNYRVEIVEQINEMKVQSRS
jgi:hypothetical protein